MDRSAAKAPVKSEFNPFDCEGLDELDSSSVGMSVERAEAAALGAGRPSDAQFLSKWSITDMTTGRKQKFPARFPVGTEIA